MLVSRIYGHVLQYIISSCMKKKMLQDHKLVFHKIVSLLLRMYVYSSSSGLRQHHQSINQSATASVPIYQSGPINFSSRCKSKNHMTTLMKTPSAPFPQKPLFLLLYHNKTDRKDSLTHSPTHPLTHSPPSLPPQPPQTQTSYQQAAARSAISS